MWRSRVTYVVISFLLTTASMVTVTYLQRQHAYNTPLKEEVISYKSRLNEHQNRLRWDALRSMSNPIKDPQLLHLYNLYQQYKNSSSTSNRTTIANDILYGINKLAFLDSRIQMIAFLLFGPSKAWSTLHAVVPPTLTPDDGFRSILKLFEKHCGGVVTHDRMKQFLANIYRYVPHKEAFREAILLACGVHTIHSRGVVDLANPKIDITPAPLHATFQYCARVSVNTVPTSKGQSYGNVYKLTVVPSKSIPHIFHHMIHICLHRNDSLGLCHCDKDDWMPIQKGSWTSLLLHDDRVFVDVKFATNLSKFVTVTLVEVFPAKGWRDGLLAGYIALLFLVVSKYFFVQNGVIQFVKRVMPILALTCLFTGYIGTYLPLLAFGSCLTLYYTITFILALVLSKLTMLWRRMLFRQGCEEFSKKEGEGLTRNMVAELVYSPEFEEWMIRNAERIRIRPCREDVDDIGLEAVSL